MVTATVTIYVNASPPPNIVVTSTAQEVPFVTNGNCTLGEAIHAANENIAVDACAVGNYLDQDIIALPNEATLAATEVFENLNNGPRAYPVIDSDLTIRGNNSTIIRSGTNVFRFFEILPARKVVLENITLTNGYGDKSTGAILNRGSDLTIIDSVFSDNVGERAVGAIVTSGPTTIINTVFDNNQILDATINSSYGGAISSSHTLTITGSTFTNNKARYGGAVHTTGTLNITDSIFDHNEAVLYGGVIYSVGGIINITDAVMTNNSASDGGVIEARRQGTAGGDVNISQSCIVGNVSTGTSSSVIMPAADYNFFVQNNWWGAVDGPTVGDIPRGEALVSLTTSRF